MLARADGLTALWAGCAGGCEKLSMGTESRIWFLCHGGKPSLPLTPGISFLIEADTNFSFL